MESGVIRRFSDEKGWGFICPDDGGGDVMLHVRELRPGQDPALLVRGARVVYDVRQTDRGLRASDVQVCPGEVPGHRVPVNQFRDEVSEVLAGAARQIEDIARRHGLAI